MDFGDGDEHGDERGDALNDVLQTLRMNGAALYRGRASGDWGMAFGPRRDDAADASFHAVLAGRCWIALDPEEGEEADTPPPVLLEAGDLAVLPRGRAHRLLATPQSRALSLREIFARTGYTGEGPLCYDAPPAEGAAPAQTVCGKFLLDDGLAAGTPPELRNPLLAALPPLLVVRGERGRAQPWLEATLGFFACESESGRPGARTVLSRLADILFIQAIRAHLAEAEREPNRRGYLAALTDPALAPALRAIHRRPEQPWTVASLAHEACLSRSAFAARFAQTVGEPPLQYLTRWRLFTAARLLRGGAAGEASGRAGRGGAADGFTLSEVAERVGYASEAAFSHAFRRWTGQAPGAYRRRPRPKVA